MNRKELQDSELVVRLKLALQEIIQRAVAQPDWQQPPETGDCNEWDDYGYWCAYQEVAEIAREALKGEAWLNQ